MSPREVEGLGNLSFYLVLNSRQRGLKEPQENSENLTMAPTRRPAATPQDVVQAGPSEQPQTQGQTDQELIAQLRTQIDALTAMLPAPEDTVARTIERHPPATTTTPTGPSGSAKSSKKRPAPPIFTDSTDPTFESWKIQMQAKL